MSSYSFSVNDQACTIDVPSNTSLLWALRTDLGLTGTKYSCGRGLCGTCTVLVNNQMVRSCKLGVRKVEGKKVTTIEGLEQNGELHPLQKAFVDNDALQCGFCTPGMIMTAVSLLRRNPRASRAEIADEMEDNLCRCGAHSHILDAIEAAGVELAAKMETNP